MKRKQYAPLLASMKTTPIPQQHTHEVRRKVGGFVVVTRRFSESDAELQKRREGGEVVWRG